MIKELNQKDKEIIEKYNAMPDLPKSDNTGLKYAFGLALCCIGLLLIPIFISIYVDNARSVLENELQEIRAETSCESLSKLRDSLGHFLLNEKTIKRMEINFRMAELNC
jgi:hypothetical protein